MLPISVAFSLLVASLMLGLLWEECGCKFWLGFIIVLIFSIQVVAKPEGVKDRAGTRCFPFPWCCFYCVGSKSIKSSRLYGVRTGPYLS